MDTLWASLLPECAILNTPANHRPRASRDFPRNHGASLPLFRTGPLPKHTLTGAPGTTCWAGELTFPRETSCPRPRPHQDPGPCPMALASLTALEWGPALVVPLLAREQASMFPPEAQSPDHPVKEGNRQAGPVSMTEVSCPTSLGQPSQL